MDAHIPDKKLYTLSLRSKFCYTEKLNQRPTSTLLMTNYIIKNT